MRLTGESDGNEFLVQVCEGGELLRQAGTSADYGTVSFAAPADCNSQNGNFGDNLSEFPFFSSLIGGGRLHTGRGGQISLYKPRSIC